MKDGLLISTDSGEMGVIVFGLEPLSKEVTDEFTSTAVFFSGNGLFD